MRNREREREISEWKWLKKVKKNYDKKSYYDINGPTQNQSRVPPVKLIPFSKIKFWLHFLKLVLFCCLVCSFVFFNVHFQISFIWFFFFVFFFDDDYKLLSLTLENKPRIFFWSEPVNDRETKLNIIPNITCNEYEWWWWIINGTSSVCVCGNEFISSSFVSF